MVYLIFAVLMQLIAMGLYGRDYLNSTQKYLWLSVVVCIALQFKNPDMT